MLLITGATGFLGKNLIPHLAPKYRCRALVRRTSSISFLRDLDNVEIAYGDVEHNEGLDQALIGIETVVHCAARTIGRNAIEYYRTNTRGTVHVVEAMAKQDVRRILYLSSHAACGPSSRNEPHHEMITPLPISFYGASKKRAEDIIQKSALEYIILRPVAVYGPHDTETLKYIRLMKYGLCPVVGHGEKYLNLIYVEDLVHLISSILEKGAFDNSVHFVNDGHCYSFGEITDAIVHALHHKCITFRVPVHTALFCGVLNDVFLPGRKRLVWRDKVRELAQQCWLCHTDTVKTAYGFEPGFTLEQGMEKTIAWYKKHGCL
jgi:nucleoside-diphosphate-sugar epimerase